MGRGLGRLKFGELKGKFSTNERRSVCSAAELSSCCESGGGLVENLSLQE